MPIAFVCIIKMKLPFGNLAFHLITDIFQAVFLSTTGFKTGFVFALINIENCNVEMH